MRVDREHKDRLFRMVFEKKEDLLSLYNALNGTDYTDPEAITVNTLGNAIYIDMKNDISFILDGSLSLYEHQSTKNANMPLRDLFYVSSLLKGMVKDDSLYRKNAIKIPTPKFVVFYNGVDEMPDVSELRLSDAFKVRDERPSLELIVQVVNVNEGHNPKMMAACRKLDEYSQFIAFVRRGQRGTMDMESVINMAIDEAIEKGILVDILTTRRAEVMDSILSEYDQEKHIRFLKQDFYEDGLNDGIRQGISQGRLYEIIDSVISGDYSLERGAEKSGLTVQELEARMREAERIVPV